MEGGGEAGLEEGIGGRKASWVSSESWDSIQRAKSQTAPPALVSSPPPDQQTIPGRAAFPFCSRSLCLFCLPSSFSSWLRAERGNKVPRNPSPSPSSSCETYLLLSSALLCLLLPLPRLCTHAAAQLKWFAAAKKISLFSSHSHSLSLSLSLSPPPSPCSLAVCV